MSIARAVACARQISLFSTPEPSVLCLLSGCGLESRMKMFVPVFREVSFFRYQKQFGNVEEEEIDGILETFTLRDTLGEMKKGKER